MKFLATIAIAAAVRLQEEGVVKGKLNAANIFKACNTDGDNDMDYGEVVKCFADNKVSKKDQKAAGNVLLKYAYIPAEHFEAVAAGIHHFVPAVSEADASNGRA